MRFYKFRYRGRYYRRNKRKYSRQNSNGKILALVILIVLAVSLLMNSVKFFVDFFRNNLWLFFTIISILCLILVLKIISSIIDTKYANFVEKYSVAVKQINDINKKYTFDNVEEFNLVNNIDNESMYINMTTTDYLTYQLQYIKDNVIKAMKSAANNNILFNKYSVEVDKYKYFYEYDIDKKFLFKKRLYDITAEIVNNLILTPCVEFEICVTLYLTNINGKVISSKSGIFNATQVEGIIAKLNKKSNGYYLDNSIWDSICAVERGKVSNKIRFAVYAKNGNKCCYCGSKNNLEIDHIIPISKGGKSTFDNLQTLCHKCNVKKSNSVPVNFNNNTYKLVNASCPLCYTGKLVVRNGVNGKFYGCSKYPKCRYTRSIK